MKRRILLLQPRAYWSKHPYMVNGLLATASRLNAAGIMYSVRDMNVDDQLPFELIEQADIIGIGILGIPHIPPALSLAKEVRNLGFTGKIFFGGPILENLERQQWQQIFAAAGLDNVVAIQAEADLKIALGAVKMPSIYDVSMGDAIRSLPEYMKMAYFEKEFCIFTSDGCVFNCSFCGAHKNQDEVFRKAEAFRDEVATIAEMVLQYAGPTPDYEIYLSTLDGCQNPESMEIVLQIIHEEFSQRGVFVPLRFLATSKLTHKALEKDPGILKRWYGYGMRCIGIGVDGDDEETWRRIRKTHNKRNEIQHALVGIQDAGMIAEAFMIFGFPEESREATLKAARACKALTAQGVKLRPYFAKTNAPKRGDDFDLTPYLKNPNLFLHQEYAMIGSEITHPDKEQREFANKVYMKTVEWLNTNNPFGCPTQPLLPTEDGDEAQRQAALEHNQNMPMDR